MFKKDDIPHIVKALKDLKNPPLLYHACQLQDLTSYLYLGGVPSRYMMQESGKSFTPFVSDKKDEQSGHDRLVFFNLTDSGGLFHGARNVPRGTPNAYGPVSIQVAPDVLLEADNVAICLRSGSDTRDGLVDRCADSLGPTDDLSKLFDENGYERWIDELSMAFPHKKSGGAVEISCSFRDELAPIPYWEKIVVDPLAFSGSTLLEQAQFCLGGRKIKLVQRLSKHAVLYSELVESIASGKKSVLELRNTQGYKKIPEWLDRINNEWMFERFSQYLISGTLTQWRDLGGSTRRIG